MNITPKAQLFIISELGHRQEQKSFNFDSSDFEKFGSISDEEDDGDDDEGEGNADDDDEDVDDDGSDDQVRHVKDHLRSGSLISFSTEKD